MLKNPQGHSLAIENDPAAFCIIKFIDFINKALKKS